MTTPQKRADFVAEFDMAELTIRLAEAACQIHRPEGKSSAEVLLSMHRQMDPIDPLIMASFARAACAAANYLRECIKNGSRPS